MEHYNGLEVVANDMATVSWEYKQWYFPISKKKRIQKKFQKKQWVYGKFRIEHAIKYEGKLIVSVQMMEKMKKLGVIFPKTL